MKEYEFRGKPTENNTTYFSKDDFVYGLLLKDDDKCYICLDVNEHIDRDDYEVYMIEVVPETVGQYTGLKDKNGKKIYEGDIVEWNYKGINKAVVFWDSMKAGFYLCSLKSYKWHIEHTSYIRQEFVNAKNKIIIGNVTDNSELLEEDK